MEASCEIAIGVIKNKIGLPPTLKGAYLISYLEIFPPLSSLAESKEGRKRKISEFCRRGVVDARSEIAIGVIKNKIGFPES